MNFCQTQLNKHMKYEVEKVKGATKEVNQTWLERNFFDMPLVAAVTIFQKFKQILEIQNLML